MRETPRRGGGWPPVSTSASCPARQARTWRQVASRSRQLPAREGAREGRDAPSADGDAPLREGQGAGRAGGGGQALVLSLPLSLSLTPNALYKAWQGALWLGSRSLPLSFSLSLSLSHAHTHTHAHAHAGSSFSPHWCPTLHLRGPQPLKPRDGRPSRFRPASLHSSSTGGGSARQLSIKLGTPETVMTTFWSCILGEMPENLSSCSPSAW